MEQLISLDYHILQATFLKNNIYYLIRNIDSVIKMSTSIMKIQTDNSK